MQICGDASMEAVFTFHSTHDAIRGERRLLDGGVKVRVMALPSCLGAGCGICLRVAMEDVAVCRGFLHEEGIVPQAVYQKAVECGVMRYLPIW